MVARPRTCGTPAGPERSRLARDVSDGDSMSGIRHEARATGQQWLRSAIGHTRQRASSGQHSPQTTRGIGPEGRPFAEAPTRRAGGPNTMRAWLRQWAHLDPGEAVGPARRKPEW